MIGPVSVVGAGIAGLAAAIGLEQAGVPVQVFERWPQLRSAGGTLLLWSNALAALERLGLRESVLDAGVELEGMALRRSDGRLLWTMPVGPASRRHGGPCLAVARATLLQLLAAKLRAPIRFGASYLTHVERAQHVEVVFEDGTRVRCRLLIGADGARSRVRRQLGWDSALIRTGQVAWIGHSRVPSRAIARGASSGTLGRGLRFWSVATQDGEVSWSALMSERYPVQTRAALAGLFARFHSPIPHLVTSAATNDLHRIEILDQQPLLRWSTARSTLVGDAAHCMRPELGQGACQALESAVTLVSELCRPQRDIGTSLRAYERRRRARTARIQLLARSASLHIEAEHPALCLTRDIGVATTFPWVAMPALDWILSS